MPESTVSKSPSGWVHGLDALRFISAVWVVFSHLPFPDPVAAVEKGTWFGTIMRGLVHNLFNGQAAVIVFFVISGFCIHRPFVHGAKLSLRAFWTQRFLRIGLPLVVALPIAWWLKEERIVVYLATFTWNRADLVHTVNASVLWSLICETVYYLLYPALLVLRRRWGWWPVLCGAGMAAFVVLATFPSARLVQEHGNFLTWIVGLPVWLAGCVLAESWGRPSPVRQVELWSWRVGIWAASIVSLAVAFHPPFGLKWNGMGWTLSVFGWLCLPWIRAELAGRAAQPKAGPLERFGAATYSIYVFHPVCINLAKNHLRPQLPAGLAAPWPMWWITMAAIAVGTAAFYFLVERPSHRFARWAGRALAPTRTPRPDA